MNSNAELLNQLRIERSEEDDHQPGRRWWLWLVAVAAFGGIGYWWFGSRSALTVTVVQGQPTTLNPSQRASVLDASGYVTARRRATVSSKVTGKVLEVLVEEGMQVEEGQLLARLDSTMTQAQLNLSEAQLERARVALGQNRALLVEAEHQHARTVQLAERGLASNAETDQTRARLQSLQAALATGEQDVEVARRVLALDRQRLEDDLIRAPFTGVVIAKAAQPGEMISPISAGGGFTRTGICTIVDMNSLEVEVDVNEAYIDRVRAGQKVTAQLDAYPDWQIPASVIAIIPAADRQKATVRVRIGFDETDPRILPDMGTRVAFMNPPEANPDAQAISGLALPASTLKRSDGRDFLFVVRAGRAERRAVAAVAMTDNQVLIRSGLQPGEKVINNPPPEMADGLTVTPED